MELDTDHLPQIGVMTVQHRKTVERAKALEKYGKAGQFQGGDPERDVLDYALNELVGLLRYADMIEYRVLGLKNLPASLYTAAVDVATDINATAFVLATRLADIRAAILEAGLDLGEPEHR